MNDDQATLEAMNAVGREVGNPSRAIHRHRVELRQLARGQNSRGDQAWVALFSDETAEKQFCVRVWARTAVTARVYNSEVDACPRDSDPQPGDDPGGGRASSSFQNEALSRQSGTSS